MYLSAVNTHTFCQMKPAIDAINTVSIQSVSTLATVSSTFTRSRHRVTFPSWRGRRTDPVLRKTRHTFADDISLNSRELLLEAAEVLVQRPDERLVGPERRLGALLGG